jgi:type IV secretion system protein VirD4
VKSTTRWHPGEAVAWAALALMLGVAVLLAATAGLAGALFGDGWAAGRLDEMPGVALRLPDHLGDPRGAWPVDERRDLPSAPGFYAVMVIVACGAGLAARAAAVRWGRGGSASGARWATSRRLATLRVGGPEPGRLVLGRHGRSLVAAERGQSALVIAPTQSGKTTALAVPAILEWDGPVIALSVKTDLLRDTIAMRRGRGRAAVFDPTGSTGLDGTSSWTPLLACRTWAGARRVATSLANGAAPNRRSIEDGDFWYAAAAKLLAPLLFAAGSAGLTMDEVVAWVDTQEESTVLAVLQATGSTEALNAMQANSSRDDRERSSIYTTAETVLDAYADPGVLAHSRAPDIQADWFLDGRANTLYLCASPREQRRLRPVFVALLQELLDAAYDVAGRRARPLDPPLLLVLDEVANIAPLPDLDVIVSTGAGHGVQLVTILQDLAQAYDRWGRERADTIVNNHRAKLLGAGLADERSLDWVGRLLGDQVIEQRSTTSGEAGRRSTTDSSVYRPLAPANVVREARAGSALLVYGNLPPAWIDLRPWFADRRLTALAQHGAIATTPDPRSDRT